MLFRAFPGDREGALAQRLSELVRKETCAAVAEDWGVGAYPQARDRGGAPRVDARG